MTRTLGSLAGEDATAAARAFASTTAVAATKGLTIEVLLVSSPVIEDVPTPTTTPNANVGTCDLDLRHDRAALT